jgi:hypothetical protein
MSDFGSETGADLVGRVLLCASAADLMARSSALLAGGMSQIAIAEMLDMSK